MSKQRNLGSPQRSTAANARKTQRRLEEYHGLEALERTWNAAPDDVQIRNHDYIVKLRARLRNVRNYILHRSDAKAEI